ncbi:hypothetical protein CVT26_006560 [Gymnopilus dilepis]|uniref:Uncharacterized protein n=1 Tax=Gymnopilus dilepis TaxID=231916 RepID=A0A409W5Y7_9AGAR|nr:hypothetical protein CVT26_006560 [Gymnopilus dilepis]
MDMAPVCETETYEEVINDTTYLEKDRKYLQRLKARGRGPLCRGVVRLYDVRRSGNNKDGGISEVAGHVCSRMEGVSSLRVFTLVNDRHVSWPAYLLNISLPVRASDFPVYCFPCSLAAVLSFAPS